MNTEQLQKIADQELPRLDGKGYVEGYERGKKAGQKDLALLALAIIKNQEERIVNFKDLAYSVSLLRAYFPKLKQELYNEIDAGQSGVAEMIRSDELQNNILHQIEKANKLLFLEENA